MIAGIIALDADREGFTELIEPDEHGGSCKMTKNKTT